MYSEDVKNYVNEIFAEDAEDDGVVLGLQLTTKCMNDCSYCGADRHDRIAELDFDILKKCILQYSEFAKINSKQFTVGLDGADNFLYSHFDEMIQWFFDNKIDYFIKCNASTLTSARIDRLIQTQCMYVRLTVCGPDTVHDALRGLDTYDMVCKKTKMMAERGLGVVWNLTIGSHNVDSMHQVFKDIPEMNLIGIIENRMYRAGMANKESFIEMSPFQWKGYLSLALGYFLDSPEKYPLWFKDVLWVPFLVERGLLQLDKFPDDVNLGCGLSSHYACLDVDGYVKGCLTLESAAKELSVETARIKFYPSGDKLFFTKDVKFAHNSYCEKCKFYRFCRGCAAVTLANTGNINAQDPQCWLDK